MRQPDEGTQVLLGVQDILLGHGGPATPIEGQAEVLRMSTSAMLGEAHHSMRSCHEVALLQLGGERAQLDLPGIKVPLGPQLVLPDALVVLPGRRKKGGSLQGPAWTPRCGT